MMLSTGMRELTESELLSVSGGFAAADKAPPRKVTVTKRIELGCEITTTCVEERGIKTCEEVKGFCGMKIIIEF